MIGTIALFQFCQIANENFAETVFLKRFGVQFLPNVFFFNSLIFLAMLVLLNRVVDRTARTKLVAQLLLVFAGVLFILRLLIFTGAPLVYPIIYIASKQMKYIFFIVFWTLATDIYSTRKARRLFPLIGGGGVLGTIVGSMLSRRIAALTGTDNLLLFCSGGMLLSYLLVNLGRLQIGRLSPVVFSSDEHLSLTSFKKFIKRELLERHGSSLLKYLIVLAILPGFAAPIFEYIFNYLADKTYLTEASLLGFFGIFKGSFNILILSFQILVASSVFRRYGIINVLFAHPIGYLLAFGGLYFNFRMPVAIMGKAGLEVIDASFYKPGCQMLYNIIPRELRGRANALVQGAVRRLGDLAGSGMLTIMKDYISPVNLSLVGPFFVVIWLFFNRSLRRSYSSILHQSLSEKHVSFAELSSRDLSSLMTPQARKTLQKSIAHEKPATALMAARLLAQSGVPGWPGMICQELSGRDAVFQTEMLRIAGQGDPAEVVSTLLKVHGELDKSSLPELLKILRRLAPESGLELFRTGAKSSDARTVAESLLGLIAAGEKIDPGRFEVMLGSKEVTDLRSGIYLAGEIGDPIYIKRLLPFLDSEEPLVRSECALALGKLGLKVSSEQWPALLKDRSDLVRLRAVEGLTRCHSPEAVRLVIPLLGDEDWRVREAATVLIEEVGEEAIPILTGALPEAGLFARSALIRILDDLGVKEQTLLKFIDGKIEEGYRAVEELKALEVVPLGRSKEIIMLLLRNRLNEAEEEIFRVLGLLVKGSRIQLILDSYRDRDETVRGHALEMLEEVLTPHLARRLLPLLEDLPLGLKLIARSHYYKAEGADLYSILETMLDSKSSADVMCALMCIQEAMERGDPPIHRALRERAAELENRFRIKGGKKVEDLMKKVLTLKGAPIFSHLQFKELLAIASLARQESFHRDDTIVEQGERGHSMYIITSGRVRIVSKTGGDEVHLATLKESDYFGEMALFDESPRSATAIADGEVGVLRVDKREFSDMLREYPGISIVMCGEFCRRLRRTIKKATV